MTGIAPNVLTQRLRRLETEGLVIAQPYSERPPRDEYVLTSRGRDFRPVLVALFAWGNRHFAPEGASILLVDGKTGAVADPVLVDGRSGRPLTEEHFRDVPGPAARESTRRRLAARSAMKSEAKETGDGKAKRSRSRRRRG